MIATFIKNTICKIIMYLFRLFPIQKDKYVFSSFFSSKYNDNPRAIFETLRDYNIDGEFIWLLRDTNVRIEKAKVVNAGSILALYHLATAHIWIDNSRKRVWAVKRRGQIYIQTWHGGIALKRVEKDVQSNLPKLYVKSAMRDSSMIDYFISGSKWQTNSIRKSFWYDGQILEYGLPRSDIFYKDNLPVKNKVSKTLGIKNDVNTLLYAPTFRVNERLDCYNIDYDMVISELKRKFGGEWTIINRLHPNIAKCKLDSNSQSVIDATDYQEINDLIIRSSVVITDYSSCMFDAMEAGKTVFLYATDVDEYVDDRGFEFDFDELPFELARNNTQLGHMIRNYNKQEYSNRVKKFMKRVHIFDDGKASERIVSFIVNGFNI